MHEGDWKFSGEFSSPNALSTLALLVRIVELELFQVSG